MEPEPAQSHTRHAWLAVALPASARRIRVADTAAAETLAQSGAELGDGQPDVEIGPLESIRGDADWAIVPFDAGPPRGAQLLFRSARRIADSIRVRLSADLAARALRRRGYRHAGVLVWDLQQPLRAPGLDSRRYRRGPAALIPLGAAARASKREGLSLYEAVRAEAEEASGAPLDRGEPMVREGVLISISPGAVLRVTLGAAREPMLRQRAALDMLRSNTLPRELESRIPWPLAQGSTGLADWTLELRLLGQTAPALPQGALLEDCLEFLVALFAAGDNVAPSSPAADAETIAAPCRSELAGQIRALGRSLEEELAGIPRGFAHGDFTPSNLLVEDGRLTGVVDWERSGPGRLPLLDLFMQMLETDRIGGRGTLGGSIVEFLLPWAKQGGDEVARGYCHRIGLELEPGLLERLVAGYWLDRFAYELRMFSDRASRRDWMQTNVENVVPALVEQAS